MGTGSPLVVAEGLSAVGASAANEATAGEANGTNGASVPAPEESTAMEVDGT